MLYFTEEHFLLKSVQSSYLLCFITESKIIMETSKKQVCLFICAESFIKKFQRLFREYCSLLFSPPFANF